MAAALRGAEGFLMVKVLLDGPRYLLDLVDV
jgi:hypothetical protein